MAEIVRPPSDKEKTRQKEKEKQAKLKRMEEIKQRLAEIEKAEKATQKSAATLVEGGAEEGGQVEEKIQVVDTLAGQLASVEAQLEKELVGEGTSEVPTKTLEDIETELAQLEQEVAKEELEKVATTYDQIKELFPWVAEARSEFMYAIPPDPKGKDFGSWQQEWSRVLFDYARLAVLHVLYVKKLMGETPFSKFRDRDRAIELIANYLVEKKLAKWLAKNREQLRVYWKSIDEFAKDLDQWARDNALLDPILPAEIREAEQAFSTLPEEDLDEVLKILKKQKKLALLKLPTGEQAIKFLF